MSEIRQFPGAPETDARLEDPALYFNREISWLAFNRRVLEEASDPAWPLLERMKFLSIFHTNLDEFFMIRVSGLHEQLEAEVSERSPDGLSPREQLRRIAAIVRADLASATKLLEDQLLPALAREGIRVVKFGELDPERARFARTYFERAVFPVLPPLAFAPAHPFPFVSNLSLSLAVELSDGQAGKTRFARVKVPASLPRFVPVGGSGEKSDFLLLEDLIEAHLPALFPDMTIRRASSFRVTRDADLEIREDEAGDLLRSVAEKLRRRRFGAVIRLEVDHRSSPRIQELLAEELQLGTDDIYALDGPLGRSDLATVSNIEKPGLKDLPFLPRDASLFEAGRSFERIAAGDILLHHPYDSFDPVLQFLDDAADDPDVLAIKMTLYRTGSDSPVVAALARAAEAGKQVAVLVELQARFDEEKNIRWAQALEQVGAHVAYGVEGLKTHAKIALVVRRGEDRNRPHVHPGTGSYNRVTSQIYTDLGLFTARPEFGSDASELFNFLTGFSKKTRYRRLTVAPFSLHEKILDLIDREAEKARAGKPCGIRAKMNSLVDSSSIRALYRASAAGVPIQLAIRGVCCLRPGLPGISETIHVSSVVGRFLEHSRAFAFGAGDEEEIYISSADWMPRNFFRRVEIMAPVLDPAACEKIRREVFQPLDSDNTRARDLDSDGEYRRRGPPAGPARLDARLPLLEPLTRRGLAAVPARTPKVRRRTRRVDPRP